MRKEMLLIAFIAFAVLTSTTYANQGFTPQERYVTVETVKASSITDLSPQKAGMLASSIISEATFLKVFLMVEVFMGLLMFLHIRRKRRFKTVFEDEMLKKNIGNLRKERLSSDQGSSLDRVRRSLAIRKVERLHRAEAVKRAKASNISVGELQLAGRLQSLAA